MAAKEGSLVAIQNASRGPRPRSCSVRKAIAINLSFVAGSPCGNIKSSNHSCSVNLAEKYSFFYKHTVSCAPIFGRLHSATAATRGPVRPRSPNTECFGALLEAIGDTFPILTSGRQGRTVVMSGYLVHLAGGSGLVGHARNKMSEYRRYGPECLIKCAGGLKGCPSCFWTIPDFQVLRNFVLTFRSKIFNVDFDHDGM